MTDSAANFYFDWRARRGHLCALHERPGFPPERLLQAIWHHQRLLRDRLRLADGRGLRVLHPGFWNREAGPDFRRAVLQIDEEPPLAGDVEIDLHSSGWHGHGHDRNPGFQGVVLHVVWQAEKTTAMSTLSLSGLLDAPLEELASWLGTDAAESFPEDLLGHCAAALRRLETDQLAELLRQAALARLQRKAHDLEARARQAGWEQALWEGLFRALGYKHNAWPMLRIGELRGGLRGSPPHSVFQWQARLFGVSGLLPAEVPGPDAGADGYFRRIWDAWWRERAEFSDCILPRALWHLHGLRPANHPLRRLALGAHWWSEDKLPARLEWWFTSATPDAELLDSLVEVLQTPRDDFWSWHWSFRGRRLDKPLPLIGSTRVTDLAMNVLLPWFWVRARSGKNETLQREAERRYLFWPAAQDNSILRLARHRLLAGANPNAVRSASAQQGLLQIVRDFCDHSDSMCLDCPFPRLVENYGSNGSRY